MKRLFVQLLVFIIITCSNFVNAQEKTPYQKRVEVLSVQLLKDIGLPQTYINDIIKNGQESFILQLNEVKERVSFFAKTAAGKDRVMVFMAQIEEAKKLKNSIDFEREENKKKEKQLQKEERLKQESKKLEDEEKQELYRNSDYVFLTEQIKKSFEKWYSKNEFEKTEDYHKRIQNKAVVFDSICYATIDKKIKDRDKSEYYGYYHIFPTIEFSDYNAEQEVFPIKLLFNKQFFSGFISVQITDAEKFKNNTSVILPKELKDWGMKQNYLFPLKMYLKNINGKSPIEVSIPINENHIKLSFTSTELNLSNYNQEELKFELEKYLMKEKEKDFKKADEDIKKAEEYINEGNFRKALEYYQIAGKTNKTDLISSKVEILRTKVQEVESKYEILNHFFRSFDVDYERINSESTRFKSYLRSEEKKAEKNYSIAIDFILSKIQPYRDFLLANDLKKEKDVWKANEDKIYENYTEYIGVFNTWKKLNKEVEKKYYGMNDSIIKILKEEKNPELLIQKIISDK